MKDYDKLAIKMQITFEVKQFFFRKSHIKQKSMQFALYYNYVVSPSSELHSPRKNLNI